MYRDHYRYDCSCVSQPVACGLFAFYVVFIAFLTIFRERQVPLGACREPNLFGETEGFREADAAMLCLPSLS